MPRQKSEPSERRHEVDLGEGHAIDAQVAQERLGDEAEALGAAGQRPHHGRGGHAQVDPAVVERPAGEAEGARKGFGGDSARHLSTFAASAPRRPRYHAAARPATITTPAKRIGPFGKTIAPLTKMNKRKRRIARSRGAAAPGT